mmetsp:Transcript_24981/g.52382  ORF Transcript_24981/g.52382 Transcript_24981/m.52382 type:complete len:346 (-) Transcript_24981:567-1604(-)
MPMPDIIAIGIGQFKIFLLFYIGVQTSRRVNSESFNQLPIIPSLFQWQWIFLRFFPFGNIVRSIFIIFHSFFSVIFFPPIIVFFPKIFIRFFRVESFSFPLISSKPFFSGISLGFLLRAKSINTSNKPSFWISTQTPSLTPLQKRIRSGFLVLDPKLLRPRPRLGPLLLILRQKLRLRRNALTHCIAPHSLILPPHFLQNIHKRTSIMHVHWNPLHPKTPRNTRDTNPPHSQVPRIPPQCRIPNPNIPHGIHPRPEHIIHRIVQGPNALLPRHPSNPRGQFPVLKHDPIGNPKVFGANPGGDGGVNGFLVIYAAAEDSLEVAVGAEVDYVGFAEVEGVVGGEGYG